MDKRGRILDFLFSDPFSGESFSSFLEGFIKTGPSKLYNIFENILKHKRENKQEEVKKTLSLLDSLGLDHPRKIDPKYIKALLYREDGNINPRVFLNILSTSFLSLYPCLVKLKTSSVGCTSCFNREIEKFSISKGKGPVKKEEKEKGEEEIFNKLTSYSTNVNSVALTTLTTDENLDSKLQSTIEEISKNEELLKEANVSIEMSKAFFCGIASGSFSMAPSCFDSIVRYLGVYQFVSEISTIFDSIPEAIKGAHGVRDELMRTLITEGYGGLRDEIVKQYLSGDEAETERREAQVSEIIESLYVESSRKLEILSSAFVKLHNLLHGEKALIMCGKIPLTSALESYVDLLYTRATTKGMKKEIFILDVEGVRNLIENAKSGSDEKKIAGLSAAILCLYLIDNSILAKLGPLGISERLYSDLNDIKNVYIEGISNSATSFIEDSKAVLNEAVKRIEETFQSTTTSKQGSIRVFAQAEDYFSSLETKLGEIGRKLTSDEYELNPSQSEEVEKLIPLLSMGSEPADTLFGNLYLFSYLLEGVSQIVENIKENAELRTKLLDLTYILTKQITKAVNVIDQVFDYLNKVVILPSTGIEPDERSSELRSGLINALRGIQKEKREAKSYVERIIKRKVEELTSLEKLFEENILTLLDDLVEKILPLLVESKELCGLFLDSLAIRELKSSLKTPTSTGEEEGTTEINTRGIDDLEEKNREEIREFFLKSLLEISEKVTDIKSKSFLKTVLSDEETKALFEKKFFEKIVSEDFLSFIAKPCEITEEKINNRKNEILKALSTHIPREEETLPTQPRQPRQPTRSRQGAFMKEKKYDKDKTIDYDFLLNYTERVLSTIQDEIQTLASTKNIPGFNTLSLFEKTAKRKTKEPEKTEEPQETKPQLETQEPSTEQSEPAKITEPTGPTESTETAVESKPRKEKTKVEKTKPDIEKIIEELGKSDKFSLGDIQFYGFTLSPKDSFFYYNPVDLLQGKLSCTKGIYLGVIEVQTKFVDRIVDQQLVVLPEGRDTYTTIPPFVVAGKDSCDPLLEATEQFINIIRAENPQERIPNSFFVSVSGGRVMYTIITALSPLSDDPDKWIFLCLRVDAKKPQIFTGKDIKSHIKITRQTTPPFVGEERVSINFNKLKELAENPQALGETIEKILNRLVVEKGDVLGFDSILYTYLLRYIIDKRHADEFLNNINSFYNKIGLEIQIKVDLPPEKVREIFTGYGFALSAIVDEGSSSLTPSISSDIIDKMVEIKQRSGAELLLKPSGDFLELLTHSILKRSLTYEELAKTFYTKKNFEDVALRTKLDDLRRLFAEEASSLKDVVQKVVKEKFTADSFKSAEFMKNVLELSRNIDRYYRDTRGPITWINPTVQENISEVGNKVISDVVGAKFRFSEETPEVVSRIYLKAEKVDEIAGALVNVGIISEDEKNEAVRLINNTSNLLGALETTSLGIAIDTISQDRFVQNKFLEEVEDAVKEVYKATPKYRGLDFSSLAVHEQVNVLKNMASIKFDDLPEEDRRKFESGISRDLRGIMTSVLTGKTVINQIASGIFKYEGLADKFKDILGDYYSYLETRGKGEEADPLAKKIKLTLDNYDKMKRGERTPLEPQYIWTNAQELLPDILITTYLRTQNIFKKLDNAPNKEEVKELVVDRIVNSLLTEEERSDAEKVAKIKESIKSSIDKVGFSPILLAFGDDRTHGYFTRVFANYDYAGMITFKTIETFREHVLSVVDKMEDYIKVVASITPDTAIRGEMARALMSYVHHFGEYFKAVLKGISEGDRINIFEARKKIMNSLAVIRTRAERVSEDLSREEKQEMEKEFKKLEDLTQKLLHAAGQFGVLREFNKITTPVELTNMFSNLFIGSLIKIANSLRSKDKDTEYLKRIIVELRDRFIPAMDYASLLIPIIKVGLFNSSIRKAYSLAALNELSEGMKSRASLFTRLTKYAAVGVEYDYNDIIKTLASLAFEQNSLPHYIMLIEALKGIMVEHYIETGEHLKLLNLLKKVKQNDIVGWIGTLQFSLDQL